MNTRQKQQKKYRESEQGKIVYKRAMQKYYQSEKGKATRRKYKLKYRQTLNGRLRCIYTGIKQRCNNPQCKDYKNYGGRGIQNKFKSADEFVDCVINDLGYDTYDKIKGLEIDRTDNNGHYEPGNIQFTTRSENDKNRRKKN